MALLLQREVSQSTKKRVSLGEQAICDTRIVKQKEAVHRHWQGNRKTSRKAVIEEI